MRGTRDAFTLTELLMVMAIITVLLALLAPTLGRAMESARRWQCAGNLEQMSLGYTEWANDHKMRYPHGTSSWDGPKNGDWWDAYSIWHAEGDDLPAEGRARWHGVLADQGLIDPDVMYCPSWADEDIQLGRVESGGEYGGWAPKGNRPSKHMRSSYHARSTFGSTSDSWRPAFQRTDPATSAIMADAFAEPDAVYKHHVEGYSVLYLNGTVKFVPDLNHQVADWDGGKSYVEHLAGYTLMEQVYSQFFKQ